jgi:hypothetical protein
VALYGLVLFEPLPLVTGIVCAAFVARWLWTGDLTLRVVAVQSLVVLAAFAAAHALMLAMFHFDLIQTVRETAADAMAFNVESRRPYGIWVRQNLVDFFFATGICQAVVFIVAVAWSVWHAKEQPAMLFLGTALAVIAADLIGINRGEVVRLWIFLACFVQIAAAFFCAIATSRTAVLLVLATTLLQSALGTSMLNFGSP